MFAYCGNNFCNNSDQSGCYESLITTSIPLKECTVTFCVGAYTVKVTVSVEENNFPIPIDVNGIENVSICSTTTVSDGFFSISVSDLGIELSNTISIGDESIELSYNFFTNTYSGSTTFERDNLTFRVTVSITGTDDFSSRDRNLSNNLRCAAKKEKVVYALGLALAVGVGEVLSGGSLVFAKRALS